MNWIKNVVRPRIRKVFEKKNTADNLWVKCKICGEMIFHRDLAKNFQVCIHCDHHMLLGVKERLHLLFDGGADENYEVLPQPEVVLDPLNFKDQKSYRDRLRDARAKTSIQDAVTVALGRIKNIEAVIGVQDFSFMGGSLGMAAGESVIMGAELALRRSTPYIMITAAGGARMQEGILSLMQMPRTTLAIDVLHEAKLPYLVVLTHPTTGGVTASYGMLGDIHIAEPGALIGFAGPRVIKQTIREVLPEGFQLAEYLLDHGMIDMVVPRNQLRDVLARLLHFLMPPKPADSQKQAEHAKAIKKKLA